MNITDRGKIRVHPESPAALRDKAIDRENLARSIRTANLAREQAREMINPAQLITDIDEIDLQLQGFKDQAGNSIPPDRETTTALKARADIKFKLLGKVLPDLKATESVSYSQHDHNHQHVHSQVSDIELLSRFRVWKEAKQATIIDGTAAPTPTAAESVTDDTLPQPTPTEDPDWL